MSEAVMSQDELIRIAAINVVKKCAEFLRLEPDWDSYGGKPVNLTTVQAAIAFLVRVVGRFGGSLGAKAIPLHVAPLSNGGIQYEWMHGDNGVEIEIHPDGVFAYLQIFGTGDNAQYHEEDNITEDQALTALALVLE